MQNKIIMLQSDNLSIIVAAAVADADYVSMSKIPDFTEIYLDFRAIKTMILHFRNNKKT